MPAASTSKRLDQLRVVVTRPAHQAEHLCHLIEQAGGTAIRLPVIEITAPDDIQAAQDKLSQLENFNTAIFTSANAVEGLFKLAPPLFSWPPNTQVAAIGKRTASILRAHAIPVNIIPNQEFNSEVLLQSDAMNSVSGKKIMIFKGTGGRTLLSETLTERGAYIETIDLYQRKRPNKGLRNIQQAGKSGSIDLFVVTSNEGLQNLFEMATTNEQEWLLTTPLVVISERTAQLAKTLGFSHNSVVAHEASDEGLLNSLEQWYAGRFRRGI
ncbi:MAG: uroporphyrinogen-III synthase [Thiotrichaceae bacterium]|nr:uroporphyrinogen-III synthase [Thiotrichaceae bacterium]PCI12811.1 MAG: uroporphyrinogen III synthase [Thiotrichales bacterium]